jgi:hypothetical protein
MDEANEGRWSENENSRTLIANESFRHDDEFFDEMSGQASWFPALLGGKFKVFHTPTRKHD